MTFILIIFLSLSKILFTSTNSFDFSYKANVNPIPSLKEIFSSTNQNFDLPKLQLSAKAYLVRDNLGKIYFAYNENQVFPIASLSKILTIYTALKYLPEETIITISPQAIRQEGFSGGFKENERFLRNDLIKASLILSSNDAAFALAETYGLNNTLYFIRQVIKDLGLTKTFIIEPTGLSAGNVSTAEDLIKLAFWFKRNNPEIASWSLEKTLTLKGTYERKLNNIALRLIEKYGDILLFQKTGFTDEAKQCFLGIVKFKNSPEIGIVLLGSQDRERDLETIIQELKKYYE